MLATTLTGIAISTIGVSPYLREFCEKTLLADLYPNLIYRMDSKKTSIPKGNAAVCQWRRLNKITPEAASNYRLTEGVTPNPLTRSMDYVRANVYGYGGYIKITDWLDATVLDPEVVENQAALGKFAAEVMDRQISDTLLTGVTNVIYAAGRTARSSVAAGDVIDDALIRKAVQFLIDRDVPKFSDGFYHGLFPTKCQFDLQATTIWANSSYRIAENFRQYGQTGKVPDLYGVRPMFTSVVTRIPGAGSGGIDVYRAYIAGPDAFGSADLSAYGITNPVVPVGTASDSDPLAQRGSQGTKWSDGTAVIDTRRIVAIEFALGYTS